jgi:FMN phosphatase YigB (HAD superfamily)
MQRPAFIYLDMGRVLLDFDHARGWERVAAASGVSVDDVEDFFTAQDRPRLLETGRLSLLQLHADFVRATQASIDADTLARAAGDIFTLRTEMLPVVAGLERAGVPMGILSNTCDIHWQHILRCGFAILPGGIDPLIFSHDVGSMKPEAAIYDEAARRAGVAAESIFFCDDIPAHVDAARAAGWDAEVFVGASQLVRQLAARGLRLAM